MMGPPVPPARSDSHLLHLELKPELCPLPPLRRLIKLPTPRDHGCQDHQGTLLSTAILPGLSHPCPWLPGATSKLASQTDTFSLGTSLVLLVTDPAAS